MKTILLFLSLIFLTLQSFSQGLENIVVETYYISDSDDATDTDGGSLVSGSVTYRIYVDMAAGYELQAVYGNPNHELRIETTTEFFNNVDRGEMTGNLIPHNRIDENTVALDSWVTMNGATTLRVGTQKISDGDGSLVGGINNDGGSEGIAGGLLVNNDPGIGIPLTTADGLIMGTVPFITVIGLDLSMLDNFNSSSPVTTNSGAWSVLDGVQGPTADNIVLIGQITTNGELSFTLNVQLGAPLGGTEQYVASSPIGNEQYFEALTYPLAVNSEGCTDPGACNYDALATEDDGSCLIAEPGCTECNANNDGLDLIDADGDLVCDANEVAGCTSASACNYDPSATDDNGSCIEPVVNCYICNANNDGLIIVDTDGDGVCDAQENPGCTSPTACNYDPSASGDDGSCIEPVANCAICNGTNDGLIIVDSDDDGICNANEIPGCTSESACNYSPGATDDNGTCIEPDFGCTQCNANNDGLILVDSDGDGICNAEEIPGCNSLTACNYDPIATDNDGSCIEPVENCLACNENNDGLVIIDSDGDGICDALENPGCLSPTACNYDPGATSEDGSCIEPVDNCQACNENNDGLVLIDLDGDGICNADEIPGCTDPDAINYNPAATDDDGTCEFITNGCGEGMGLEDVIVEIYYVSDANDSGDEDGGSPLALGSTTYRIYVDMAEGYELQAVFGNPSHELRLETTTYFYNNTDRGEQTGDVIDNGRLDENTVALDSWLTMGAASDIHFGVLKSEDPDGSIVGGANNDGGSENIPGGLLVNDNVLAGIPITTADGLMEGTVPVVTAVGIDLEMFGNENGGPVFTTNSGAWSVLEGTQGPGTDNKVLIAQITTDGEFCFELNLQLGTPEGGTEQYVSENPQGDQLQCDLLNWCSSEISDVLGCTNLDACNYDPNATLDDGTCLIPVEDCWECNENNDALIIVDVDGDGVCNAEEIYGCTDPNALNYNPEATEDDGSCIVGVEEYHLSVSDIHLFPNPTDGELNFEILYQGVHTMQLAIVDAIGREVIRNNSMLFNGNETGKIDLTSLADGWYVVRFTLDGMTVSIPVSKN